MGVPRGTVDAIKVPSVWNRLFTSLPEPISELLSTQHEQRYTLISLTGGDMKPDTLHCKNCGKDINKGTWCSDKCRMAFKRKGEQKPEQTQGEHEQNVPEQPKSDKPEHEPGFRSTLTKTDKTYYDRAMRDMGEPYYRFFGVPEHEVTCVREQCGAKFTTTLNLCRYCSYEHYKQTVSGR